MALIYVLAKQAGEGDASRVRIHGVTDKEEIADTWEAGHKLNRMFALNTDDRPSFGDYCPCDRSDDDSEEDGDAQG